MSNSIFQKTTSDPQIDTLITNQQKEIPEREKGYPDPRKMDSWEYQAKIAGYESGEEFKQAYIKKAVKAGGVGVAAGVGLFVGAFGISAGSIIAGPKLAAVAGFVVRTGSRAALVAKNVGVKAWNVGKSVWLKAAGTAASTPQATETVKKVVECVEGIAPGTPAPSTPSSGACNTIKNIYDLAKEQKNDQE